MKDADVYRKSVEGYMNTVVRLEPDIHPIDAGAYYASAAISLKRIADCFQSGKISIMDAGQRRDLFYTRILDFIDDNFPPYGDMCMFDGNDYRELAIKLGDILLSL